MERNILRELKLTSDEVEEAVKYWLANAKDIQVGLSPEFEFDVPGAACAITSEDKSSIDLLKT